MVAIAAAQRGASSVTGWDVCPRAVACAGVNAASADVTVDARRGNVASALVHGPYDVVTANPPYVPTPHDPGAPPAEFVTGAGGPAWAFNAGLDGRLVLNELCTAATGLLTAGGTMLIVQSEFASIDDTLAILRGAGLFAEVVARQRIPFGPVLTARAPWLRDTGRLAAGQRHETLAVIRADKPRP